MSNINVQSFSGKVKVSNDLTVTTNVHADYFKGNGSLLTNLPSGSGGVWNTNSDNEIYFISSNVGISNADPGHNLSVGSNLYVDDDGSNVIVVTGNVKADYFVGDGSLLTGLSGSGGVWSTNAANEIYFINNNVGISNADPGHNLSVGSNLYVDDDGLDVLNITGNVNATYLKGNGSLLTNLPSGSGGVWSTNAENEIYFINNNVGISNADPGHNLSVGSNLFVDDDGINVLVVDGNVAAESMIIGGISIAPSYPLSSVTDTGNVTPHTIEFTNATTGIVVDSNIVVAGNVTAAFLYGDASNVTGIASNLHQIVENGNVTSNTVQFTNATTGLVTTANVEVGGELTVTGNVVVDTNTLFVDSVNNRVGVGTTIPGSALHVVGDVNVVSNVNMLHTSNTASIKLNSNVVTEFPRSKKLIKYPRVAMTTATTGGYTATASGEESATRQVENIFNNLKSESGGGWRSNTGYNASGIYTGSSNLGSDSSGTAFATADKGEWVKIQLPNKIQLSSFTLTPRLSTTVPAGSTLSYGKSEFIKKGKIWGSLNGTSWSLVHTITGTNASSDTIINSYTVISSTAYNYFALVVTETNTEQAGIPGTSLSEFELFGTPEYDPEADGVDVVVKSVPNVPNTDWLEVYYDAKDLADGATTVNDLKPVGTANNGVANGNLSVSGGAFVFDGSGDYISSTVTTTTGAFVHTFAFWMNISSSSPTNSSLIGFGTQSSDQASVIRFDGAEKFRWYFWGNDIKFTTPNVRDKWVHVVATYDGGNDSGLTVGNVGVNRKIFINTKETTVIENVGGSAGSDALNLVSTSHAFRVGSSLANGELMVGKIANARLFNRVLTPDEIYQLYAYQKEYFGHGMLGMTLKAGRLGIGTSEPRAALDVRGDIHGGCPVYFQALYNANFSATAYNNGTNGALIPWNKLFEHKGGCFDTSTGLFKAPIDGVYRFGYSVRKQSGSYSDMWTYIQKNGSAMDGTSNTAGRVYVSGGSSGASVFTSQTFILDLSAGDTIGILLAESNSSGTDARMSNSYNYFHGYYIGTGNGSFGSYSY